MKREYSPSYPRCVPNLWVRNISPTGHSPSTRTVQLSLHSKFNRQTKDAPKYPSLIWISSTILVTGCIFCNFWLSHKGLIIQILSCVFSSWNPTCQAAILKPFHHSNPLNYVANSTSLGTVKYLTCLSASEHWLCTHWLAWYHYCHLVLSFSHHNRTSTNPHMYWRFMSSKGVAFPSVTSSTTDLNLFLEGEDLAGYILFAITVVSGVWSPLQRCANILWSQILWTYNKLWLLGTLKGANFLCHLWERIVGGEKTATRKDNLAQYRLPEESFVTRYILTDNIWIIQTATGCIKTLPASVILISCACINPIVSETKNDYPSFKRILPMPSNRCLPRRGSTMEQAVN